MEKKQNQKSMESINIDPSTRIFIIEGIPGSGKNTLHEEIKKVLSDKLIYEFSEEYTLFSWHHYWLKNISTLRIELMQSLLDYYEEISREDQRAVFIFNRFHLSFFVLGGKNECKTEEKYNNLLNRLRRLPVHIYIPILDANEIELRSSHPERTQKIWAIHLKKRMAQKNAKTLKEVYVKEQDELKKLLQTQGIPHTLLSIKIKK